MGEKQGLREKKKKRVGWRSSIPDGGTFSWEKNKENGDFSRAFRGGFWGAGVRAEEGTNLCCGEEGSEILEIKHQV